MYQTTLTAAIKHFDKYEDEENPSSVEELAIIYTEFGAKCVEVEDDGKVVFTCDP